ncbi:MAG: hypothetical protein NUV51_00165 [Sulfuricaulis sp.]|nr:hypothetical protein [Sulfuricaulis sp.]
MSRNELEKLLSRHGGVRQTAKKKPTKAAINTIVAKSSVKSVKSSVKSAQARTKKERKIAADARDTAHRPPTPGLTPKWEWVTDNRRQPVDEEQVESAKYATVLPGTTVPRADTADLNEDIDNLPPVTEPTLCLLPQKPGVLHGYWIVPPNSIPTPRSLKLRLGRITRDVFEIIIEMALPDARGRWYFHLDEAADVGAVYLQLGYYEPGGRFVTATRRGIARIPSLYASDRTDRLWWVSEEQFSAMYRRAGGYVRGPRLGWAASISSPGGAPGAPSSDRLA